MKHIREESIEVCISIASRQILLHKRGRLLEEVAEHVVHRPIIQLRRYQDRRGRVLQDLTLNFTLLVSISEKRSWLTASHESGRPLLPAHGVAMNTRELVSNLAGITGYEIERARPIRIAKAWVRPPRPAHSGPARTDIWPGRLQYNVSLHAEPRVYYLHRRCT